MNAYFTAPEDDTWLKQAACRADGIDPELFFPAQENGPSLKKARAVCKRCPVKPSCLQDAMATEGGKPATSRHGVYAGLTGNQRYGLYTRARERARNARKQEAT